MTTRASRAHVLRYRVQVQQLDRRADPSLAVTDSSILDLGVQDSGPDGALWALAIRGVPVRAGKWSPDLALAWTLRGAPHVYRRADLPHVQVAVRPFSDGDAAKRIFGASKPLKAAGIRPTDALADTARAMRKVVAKPTPKGSVSTRMAQEMSEPYLRWCRVCQATHMYEMSFRLAALHAGLELEPDTSPPVLRRVKGWPRGQVGVLDDVTDQAPSRLDLVRGTIHLLGPTTPKDVAGFIDAPVSDVKARWPRDVVEVDVAGAALSLLAADLEMLRAAARSPDEPVMRLLGPFDLFLQARDRAVVVPDSSRHRALWPTIGRPGAVLVDGEVVGTWRPRAKGRSLGLELDQWTRWSKATRQAVGEQHELLAAFRGVSSGSLVDAETSGAG